MRRVVVAITWGMLTFGVAAMPAGASATSFVFHETHYALGAVPLADVSGEALVELLASQPALSAFRKSALAFAFRTALERDVYTGGPESTLGHLDRLTEAELVALVELTDEKPSPPKQEPTPEPHEPPAEPITPTTHEETPRARTTTTPEPTPTPTPTTPTTATPVNTPSAAVIPTHATTPRFRVLSRRARGRFTFWTVYAPSAGELLVHRHVIRRIRHAGIVTVRVRRGATVVWRRARSSS